ncbi:MAG: ABC transporter permease, partial [Planctomycetota bacterium]|nr:ABC transporter permease [Planctomycetota bacterium]
VGVGSLAITLVLSLSTGLRYFIRHQVATLSDPKVVQVFPLKQTPLAFATSAVLGRLGKPPRKIAESGGMNPGAFNFRYFTQEEIEFLRKMPHITEVRPGILVFVDWIALEGSEERYEVVCIPEGEGFRMEVAVGRGFSEDADDEVVLSYKYLEAFGFKRPEELLGKNVVLSVTKCPLTIREGWGTIFGGIYERFFKRRSKRITVKVVGLAQHSLLSMVAFIPYKLGLQIARYFLDDPSLHSGAKFALVANIVVDDEKNISRVRKAIEERGMSCITVEDRLGFLLGIFFIVEVGLSVFAGIALLVAALGITNTLVSSVYERRQEIGVMKALGCRSKVITRLFCMEAVLVGIFGGFIGCVAAFLLANVADTLINLTFAEGWGGVSFFLFRWWLPFLSLLFCAGCAFLAGAYPAHRAGVLDPIRALREE